MKTLKNPSRFFLCMALPALALGLWSESARAQSLGLCQQLFEELGQDPSFDENSLIARCHQVTHPNYNGEAKMVISRALLCIRRTKDEKQRSLLELVGEMEVFEDDLKGRVIPVYGAGYVGERGEAFDGWAAETDESAVIRQNDEIKKDGTHYKVTREVEFNKLSRQLLVTENQKRSSLFSPWKTHFSIGMNCGEEL